MLASVVVVDPESAHTAPAQVALQALGCEVLFLRDAREASEWCPRIQPDLVLLALSALTEDTRQIIRGLKTSPRTRLTPIVSFREERGSRSEASRHPLPVDESLSEPIWHSVSLNRIQGILALKRFVDRETESALISTAISVEDHFLCGKGGHCQRVSDYAVRLGRRVGMPESQLETLRLGAVLHDIGKIAVPAAILCKPGPLTAEEEAAVRSHPAVGEEICSPLKSLRPVLPIIRYHHERRNGSGYPDGLEGEEIPPAAHILQVADIYDALTSDRPYRRALTPSEALRILHEEVRQGWRDENIVSALKTLSLSPERQEKQHSIVSGSPLRTEELPEFPFGSCLPSVLHPSGFNS